MISITNNSMKQTLHQYLLQYLSAYKKRSYLLFTWLIAAILCTEEVRSVKFLIERYVNLLAIAFAFVQVLPFIAPQFRNYQFQSSQIVKRAVAEQLTQELIFDTFVKRFENNKIYSTVKNAVDDFLGLDHTA